MKDMVSKDDKYYALKHAKLVGGGWYWLSFLLLFSWLLTFGLMVWDGEFSLWPLAFFVGLVFSLHKIGRGLRDNGYVHSKERKPVEQPPVKQFYIPQSRCSSPDWIQIPMYRDFEIHCDTYQVRHRDSQEIVVPGHDPEGGNYLTYVELGHTNGRINYVLLDWVIENALKRKV